MVELIARTGVRLNEALLATWSEFDFENMVWNVPWQHLKKGDLHKTDRPVPIPPALAAMLKEMKRHQSDEALVFPSPRPGGGPYDPSSCMAFLIRIWPELVRQPDGSMRHITLHGFRATLAVWADETTDFLEKLVEHQLNHKVGDGTHQAYFRSPLFQKRRKMMEAYNNFIDGFSPLPATGTDNVLQINEARQQRRWR
jgi:integrase